MQNEKSVSLVSAFNIHTRNCVTWTQSASRTRSGVTTAIHSGVPAQGKKGNVLFNDALNTFYIRLYGVKHMVKDHSDSERGNLLPPHGLLFPISSIIPQLG